MKKFGLFIGIDRYRKFHSDHHLHCAGLDARALAQVFASKLGFVTRALCDVDLGYEGKGNHELIFEQLESWQAQLAAQEEAVLLLYFAGHGTVANGQQYLLAPNAPADALDAPEHAEVGVITESRLRRACARWPNTRRVLVFDACRTALVVGAAPDTQVQGRGLAVASLREAFVAEPGLAVLRACPLGQMAFELRHFGDDKKSHGLYTAALLDVLHTRASNDETVLLDDGLNHDIGTKMRELASLYAPPEHKVRVEQQQPLRHGELICLIDGRELKTARLLSEFEIHFAAGRTDRPMMQCCRDTLSQLHASGYDVAGITLLSARIAALEKQREHDQNRARSLALLESARVLQTPEAYLRVREAGFAEHALEVATELERLLAIRAGRAAQAQQAQAETKVQQQAMAQALKTAKDQNAALAQALAQEKAEKSELEARHRAMAAELQQLKLKQQRSLEQAKAAAAANADQAELAASAQAEATAMLKEVLQAATKSAPNIITGRVVGGEFQDDFKGGGKGPLMVVLPSGRFQIGSGLADDEKNGPVVSIAKPFAVGKYPVTVAQYLMAGKAGNKYHYQTGSDDRYREMGKALFGDKHPIVGISWDDAKAWLQWLNANMLDKAGGYRLLSEAEWEYAARAGNNTRWGHGDDEAALAKYAWYEKNSNGEMHEVGGKLANAFGLHDMHGNVWEWVEDGWHKDYLGAPDDGSAWVTDSSNENRVLRGGSWKSTPDGLRSACRGNDKPIYRNNNVGFRIARTLP
jgi:formylglycine-generating enzyme required for sulfatase activity